MRALPTPTLLLTMLLLSACQPVPQEAADAARSSAAVVEAEAPTTPATDANGHVHDHAIHAEAQPEPPLPPHGQRWQADAALTRGMQALRAVVDDLQSLPQQADQAAVAALGERVEHTVHTLFAECRLAPEPDAALHALLADVIGARQQLGTEQSDPGAAQTTLTRVLEQYEARFVDQP